MKIINFVIGIFRFFYVLVGILLLWMSSYSPLAAGAGDGFAVAFCFIVYAGLGIMFLWMQHMLKKRKAFIRKFILFIHSIILLGCIVGIFNLFFGPKNYLIDFKEQPFYFSSWYIFWFFISLFPIWLFTSPKVKAQFK